MNNIYRMETANWSRRFPIAAMVLSVFLLSGNLQTITGQTPPAQTPDLNGTWLFRGIKGQNCTITQTPGGRLSLTTEKGERGNGTFENDTTIVVDFPFARGLRGSITENGFRIKWANGESWMRAEDRQPTPGWYVAARTNEGEGFSLALKIEKRGRFFQVTGVIGNPANTKMQGPVSGSYSAGTKLLFLKWTTTTTRKRTVEIPINGNYDPIKDAFDAVLVLPAMGRFTFHCVRSK